MGINMVGDWDNDDDDDDPQQALVVDYMAGNDGIQQALMISQHVLVGYRTHFFCAGLSPAGWCGHD